VYRYNKKGVGGIISVEYDRKERGVEFLLQKYETKQPGEINGKTDKKMKIWRLKQKIRYADTVMDRLNMKGIQREQVYHLLKDVPDLKALCRKCADEKIIAVISFYVKFCTTPKVALSDYNKYTVCREHDMSLEMYSRVVTNLAKHFQSHMPLSAVRYV